VTLLISWLEKVLNRYTKLFNQKLQIKPSDYSSTTTGTEILSTAAANGKVDAAICSSPHFVN